MSRSFAFTLASLVIIVCSAGVSRADDKDDVKAAGKAFVEALNKADGAEAHKYVYSDENSAKFVDTIIDITVAHKKLTDAAVDKFGDAGKDIAGAGMGARSPIEIQKNLDDAEVDVHGDMAVMTPKTGKPVNCKKDGGQWKIDFSDMANNPQLAVLLPMMGKIATAMTETAGEIKDGKYKTLEEAKMGYRMKMAAAVGFPGGAPGGFPGGVPRGPRPPQQ